MHDDGEVREAAISIGLNALSAFSGAVFDLPKNDEQLTQMAGYCAGGLQQAIDEIYGM